MSQYSDPSNRPSVWKRTQTKLFPNPWRRSRREEEGSGSGNLFWLSVLFLGAISLICISWGASSAVTTGGGEKSLRIAPIIPKFNIIDKLLHPRQAGPIETNEPPLLQPTAEVPPPPPPPPNTGSLPRMVAMTPDWPDLLPRSTPTVEPPLITTDLGPVPSSRTEPVKAPVELLLPGVSLDPLIHASFYGLGKPGETPMVRYLRIMTMYPFLAAAFPAVPSFVHAGGQPPLVSNDIETKKLRDAIEALTAHMRTQPTTQRSELSTLDVRKLSEEISAQITYDLGRKITDVSDKLKGLVNETDSFKSRLNKIDDSLADLKRFQEDYNREKRSTKDRLDELDKAVANLEKDLRAIRKTAVVEVPTAPVAAAPLPLEKVNDKSLAAFEELKQRIDALSKSVARLDTPAPSATRTSLAPPTTHAKVMLVNQHDEDLLFIVNGQPHRVAPKKNQLIDNVVPGAMTYEVVSPTWGRQANQTVSLAANETFTVTAR